LLRRGAPRLHMLFDDLRSLNGLKFFCFFGVQGYSRL